MRALDWVVRLTAAAILLQTLYFKFTAAQESVYIFTTLGIEPWGRIGSGLAELVASALLLWGGTGALGAVIAAASMSVAIASHLTVLGIEVQGDRGLLFSLAWVVLLCSLTTIAFHRERLRYV